MIRPATIRGYAYGIITGTALTAGIICAAPAKADVVDAVSQQYAPVICEFFDEGNASIDGIKGVGLALMGEGWTPREAGEIVGWSVVNQCPRYIPLLKAFIARYGSKNTAAA